MSAAAWLSSCVLCAVVVCTRVLWLRAPVCACCVQCAIVCALVLVPVRACMCLRCVCVCACACLCACACVSVYVRVCMRVRQYARVCPCLRTRLGHFVVFVMVDEVRDCPKHVRLFDVLACIPPSHHHHQGTKTPLSHTAHTSHVHRDIKKNTHY